MNVSVRSTSTTGGVVGGLDAVPVPVSSLGMLIESVPPGSGWRCTRLANARPGRASSMYWSISHAGRYRVATAAVDPGQVAVLLEGGVVDNLLGVGGEPGAGLAVAVEVQGQPDQIAAPGLAVVAAPVDEVASVSVVHGVP